MPGKILAAVLLVFGGGITLFIFYKIILGLLQPVAQKKLEQKMMQDKVEQLGNNLKLHEQPDQVKVKQNQQKMK